MTTPTPKPTLTTIQRPEVGRPPLVGDPGPDFTLMELLDRVIEKGVILGGDLTLAVADVDLLYLGVRLLLCSTDRIPDGSPLRRL